MKFCPMCDEMRPVSEFNRDKSRKDGRDNLCRYHKNLHKKLHQRQPVTRRKRWKRSQKYEAKEKARGGTRKLYPEDEMCAVKNCFRKGERHHLDYENEAEVIFLCRKHHKMIEEYAEKLKFGEKTGNNDK